MEVLYIEWTGLAVNDVLFAQTVVYIAVQIDVRYAAVHDIVGHYALARNVSQLVAHIVVEARKVHIVVQKVCIVDVWNWGSELDGKNWGSELVWRNLGSELDVKNSGCSDYVVGWSWPDRYRERRRYPLID